MTSKPDSPASSSNESDADEARAALRNRAREAIAKQPARTVTILSSLLAAQDELRYLPFEAIDEVAQRMSATTNAVWGIASFYPNFRFTEPNRHKVELCWGPTCHVLGAQHILQGLLPHMGLTNEGDTEDGVISFKLNTCLGVCAHGPAMSFENERAGHMSLDKAVRLVERIKADDEEVERATAMIAESERSKALIVAKAAIRTAERAAKAEAAAKLKAEEDARIKAEEEAAAKVEAEAKAAEDAKAAEQAKVAAEAKAAEDPQAATEPAATPDAETPAPNEAAVADDAPAVEADAAAEGTPVAEAADNAPAAGDAADAEPEATTDDGEDDVTEEASEETKDD